MNIFVFSRFGDSMGLCRHLSKQHDVTVYIDDKKYRDKGKGINQPRRVDFWEPHVDKADLIVFDMSGKGGIADSLRKRGKLVIGAGEIADQLEDDRAFAMNVVKKYCKDVNIAEFKKFTSIKDGIAFLEKQDKPYVFKPDGLPTQWTYVPRKDDNNAVISVMRSCPKQNVPFILQEKLPHDEYVELSTEGWFHGKQFVEGSFNHTMEEKRFLSGGYGRNVGCAGSIVWPCGRNKLVEVLLIPLEPLLASEEYVGPVDVNAMVGEDEIYFLEFSLRNGYDAVQNLAMLTDDFGQFLMNVATGKEVELKNAFSMSARLSYPPYPSSEDDTKEAKDSKGLKVVEIPEELDDSVMLVDVMKNDDGELVLAGTDNVIGTVHAISGDVENCQEEIYGEDGIINAIALASDLQFRNDIGKGVEEEIAELEEWGWL